MNNSRIYVSAFQTIAPQFRLHALRLSLLVVLVIACAPSGLAQTGGDYNKVEVYGGYSLGRIESSTSSVTFVDPGGNSSTFSDLCSQQTGEVLGPNSQQFFCKRRNFNGFEGSITYNLTKYIGIKGDVSGHFKTDQFVDVFTPPGITQTIDTKERLYNFLGGVQVKNNSKTARFKPFAHALVGVARYTGRQQQTLDLLPQFNFTAEDRETAFAIKIGGGLDIRVSRKVDIRVFQFDYNPMFAGDRSYETIAGPFSFSSTGKTANNFIFGVGIVIH